MTGCATSVKTPGQEPPKVQLAWPAPPDAARFAFEATLRNGSNIRKEETPEDRMLDMLTGRRPPPDEPVYRKPSAIVARLGRIYLADPPTRSIHVFDVPRRRLFTVGVREPNVVINPIALAVDKEGRLYVLDAKLMQVLVFDALGLYLSGIDLSGQVSRPVGLAVARDGQLIYVVDRGSVEGDDHKVVAFMPDGSKAFNLGSRGRAPGQFDMPIAAAVSPDDRLHVLDAGNFRVQSFDRGGRFVSAFGSIGNTLGQFSRMRSIAADGDGNLYVTDATFNNVQIFNAEGSLLMWLGRAGRENLPGQYGLIGAIAVDETGRLYVVDQLHPKVEVFRRVDRGQPG